MSNHEPTVVVRLNGNPNNHYFRMQPCHALQLGVEAVPGSPCELRLMAGCDGTATLILPTGRTFTAKELTELANKGGDSWRGWEVWTLDPLGYPSTTEATS